MKVAIGFTLQDGPYGGGNSVIRSLSKRMTDAGHDIRWTLDDDDIDVIVLVDPRTRSPNISFGAGAILRYLAFRNSSAIVVQQIHDCDERKNTKTMNLRQRIANYAADHTICVGSWMLDLDVIRPENRNSYSTILNGGDTDIFHRQGHTPWNGEEPLKLVTHHWGGHRMKGFDVYGYLDSSLESPTWKQRIEFTYVGNVPSGFAFRNVRHLPPMAGTLLADELRRHHVYITASINEPAGLHHIEGALCGLPILYRNSGALPEYCDGFGICFQGVEDIETAIDRMSSEYEKWFGALDHYEYTEKRMVDDYILLFERLMAGNTDVVRRPLWRNPLLFALNQVPF